MRAPLLLLLLLAVPVSASEVPFTTPEYGPAPSHQLFASVASDGTDYLVVWTDWRTAPSEAYATRVTRDGVVLDPAGIRIPAKNINTTQVVWTGSSYLVLWAEGVGRVSSVRISREGRLVQEPRVLIADAQLPHAIQAGSTTVIGYLSARSSPEEPRAVFFDDEGNVEASVTLGSGGTDLGSPAIAWNGSELVAVWTRGNTSNPAVAIDAVRFDAQGVRETTRRTILASGYNIEPQIASDGRDFVLLTRSYDTGIYRTTHIATDLTAGATYKLPRQIDSSPTLLWTGSQYVVVGDRDVTVSAVRLDRDARPMDAQAATIESIPPAGTTPAAAAATNGTDLLVAWNAPVDEQQSGGGYDVYAGLYDASTLARRARVLLTITASRQIRPLVASSGAGLLLVWNEGNGLFAQRANFDGRPVDPAPIRLGGDSPAAVSFNGTDYLVAWIADEITTRRIPASGPVDTTNVEVIKPDDHVPSLALASDAGTTLLAWTASDVVFAARLAADGSLQDPVPLELAHGTIGGVAAAASDGRGFLVTWVKGEVFCCHGSTVAIAIAGARVTREGTALDAGGFTIADTTAYEDEPALTWNGTSWLVAWHRDGGAGDEVRARRITLGGSLLDGSAQDPGLLLASRASRPQVVWDGTRYFLSWLDDPSLNDTLTMYGAWVNANGGLTGARQFGEGEAFALAGAVTLAPIAPGRVAVAYARIAREAVYGGVSRAFLNPVSPRRRAVR